MTLARQTQEHKICPPRHKNAFAETTISKIKAHTISRITTVCVCVCSSYMESECSFFFTSTLLNTIRLAKRDAVLCVLGNLPASELLVPTFRNFLSVSIFLGVCFFGFMLIFLEMNLLLLAQRIILVGVGKSRLSLQMLRDVQFLFQEAGLPFNPFLHHFLRFYENRCAAPVCLDDRSGRAFLAEFRKVGKGRFAAGKDDDVGFGDLGGIGGVI